MRHGTLAAQQGNADAQYLLGLLYEEGMGVKKDHAEAVKWMELAAKQGNKDAQEYFKEMQKRAQEEKERKNPHRIRKPGEKDYDEVDALDAFIEG